MEENAVELIDYFRVIWKRKILIIVMILVGLGIGAGVKAMNSKPKPPKPLTTYCSDVVVKIGKKVRLVPVGGGSVSYIENPRELVRTFPLEQDVKIRENPGYHLNIEQVEELFMVKLTMEGPDKGVEKVLEELVKTLIDKHRIKAKDSVVAYNNFMKKMEADAEMLKKEIFVMDKSIEEMKERGGEYLRSIETSNVGRKGDIAGGDRSAFLNILYLKTIDKEKELSRTREALRKIQKQLTLQQITLGNLEEYKTELVGKIRSSAIEPKKKKHSTIALAVVAGLIMSLFIAFFMEYIEESKSKRKGKLQG